MSKPYLGTTGAKRADIILNKLGDPYRFQVIDGEPCLYRIINNKYDVEISGVISRKHVMSIYVYVWDRTQEIIVKTVSNIETIEELQKHLKAIENSVSKDDLQTLSTD